MQKQNKKIIAGLIVMAAMLSVSMTYSTAFAQETDLQRPVIEKHVRPHTVLVGTGAAVSADEQGWRSHFRMGIVSENQNTDVAQELKIKQGTFVVGKKDGRHVFSVIPDTWTIEIRDDKTSFDASGTVENREGKTFDVKITGEKIAELQHGNLYMVKGVAVSSDSDERTYDLFYISAMHDRSPSIRPASVESDLS